MSTLPWHLRFDREQQKTWPQSPVESELACRTKAGSAWFVGKAYTERPLSPAVVACLSVQIDNGPVLLTLLNVAEIRFPSLMAPHASSTATSARSGFSSAHQAHLCPT